MLSYLVVVMHMFKIVLLILCLIFSLSVKETYLMQLKELLPSAVTLVSFILHSAQLFNYQMKQYKSILSS